MRDNEQFFPALDDTARTGVRVAGLRVSSYAVGFVASILIARALGPEGRGLYAFPIAFLGIVMAVSNVGLEHANVFLAGQGVSLRRLWSDGTLAAVLIGALVWALIAGLYAGAGKGLFAGLPAAWIAVSIVQVPLLLQTLYWSNLLQLNGRLRSAVRASVASVAVHAVLCGILYVSHALTPFRVLLLTLAANGTTWGLLLLLCARTRLIGAAPEWSSLRRGVLFGLKAHIGLIFFFLALRVDQVLVQRMLGFHELGLYSLAVTLAELIWLLSDPFAASLLPHQVRATRGDERGLGYATARMSLMVAAVAGAVAWIAAPHAIRVLYGVKFEGSVWPFRLLLPGVVALAALRPLAAILLKEGRPWLLSGLGLLSLVLNLIANLMLLPAIGIAGASLASTIAYLTLAVAYVMVTRRTGVAGWRDLRPRSTDLKRLRRAFSSRSRADWSRTRSHLRVLLMIGTLDRGGSEGQVVALARGLRARGHEVTVLCLGRAGPLAQDLRLANVDIVEGYFQGLRPWPPNPLSIVRAFRTVRTTLHERQPDVVHTVLYWSNLVGVVFGRLARIPVVVSSQRSLQHAVRSHPLLRPWERLTYWWSDAIVCNSTAVLADAVRAGRIPSQKARVIYNGVDAIPDEPTSPPPGRISILVIANLIAYKGHNVLLKAFASALPQLGAEKTRLELAGSGPEEANLRGVVRQLGIEAQVRFLGSVSDVRGLLVTCTFTVLPSLTEGMPNAVLESLACGRPVIASRVGGVPEILTYGGGIMVPAGDHPALAEALVELAADPDRARALGERGRRMVESRFGLQRMVDENLVMYLDLLSKKGLSLEAPTESRAPGETTANPSSSLPTENGR